MTALRDELESIDPNDVKEYTANWEAEMNRTSDTIATSVWAIDSGTATIDSDTNTTTSATVWLSAATAGPVHARNRITTTGGRTLDQTLILTVESR